MYRDIKVILKGGRYRDPELHTLGEDFELSADAMPERIEIHLLAQDATQLLRYSIVASKLASLRIDVTAREATLAVRLPALYSAARSRWSEEATVRIQLTERGLELALHRDSVPWLMKNDPVSGSLDSFTTAEGEARIQHRCAEVRLDGLPFVVDARIGQIGSYRVAIGLFASESGDLHILCVPTPDVDRSERALFKLSCPDDESGWRYRHRSDQHADRQLLSAHVFPLSQESGYVHFWHAAGKSFLDDWYVKRYKAAVKAARKGQWQTDNSMPTHPLPTLSVERTPTSPGAVLCFGGAAAPSTLRYFVPAGRDSAAFGFKVKLDWKARNSGRLTYEASTVEGVDVAIGQNLKAPLFPDDTVGVLIEMASKAASGVDAGDFNGELQLKANTLFANAADAGYRRLGALELKAENITNAGSATPPAIVTRLRSVGDGVQSGLLASCDMKNLPATARYSTSGDPDVEFTTLTSAGALEDALHRDSDGIYALVDDDAEGVAVDLDIRSDARFGANLTVEFTLRERNFGYRHPDALFFQARPFLFAKLSSIRKDPEGGRLLARWRNDDDSGAQWRLPYDSVTLEMPSQAVGEEMERGNRFWEVLADGSKSEESYIDDSKTIRYRFSPTTMVELRPDRGRRRFNTAPNNVFRIVEEAGVQSFRTEMAYPIAIGFERDGRGEPDIWLGETGDFFGKPGQMLPVADGGTVSTTLARGLFEGGLGRWAAALEDDSRQDLSSRYRLLRLNTSAAKANFASRLAQLHLYDPLQSGYGLFLNDGLSFEIRSHGQKQIEARPLAAADGSDRDIPAPGSTPPLMNPLPATGAHIDLPDGAAGKGQIAEFLKGLTPTWGTGADGAIRGGVIHTIEFPSELLAVLRTPRSSNGIIESLSFSNLGATGSMEVAFDEGRTLFTVEVVDGQLSRLLKTRIGRLGIVWNKAKHIIVYERTVLPSTQFENQQAADPHLGWPILRKTEEYVEPIEVSREFSREPDADKNSAAFLDEFECVSRRIYVDGAWGSELEGAISGYEIPLWDGGRSQAERDKNGQSGWFYPKPKLAFVSRGADATAVRQWIDDPDELVFYTNTMEGAGGDPDAWEPVAGTDAPRNTLFRMGVFTPTPKDWNKFLSGRAPNAPLRDALRRKRFELRVRSDAAVDIQATRSDSPVLASIDLVSVARSAETGSPPDWLTKPQGLTDPIKGQVKKLNELGKYAGTVAQLSNPIESWLEDLPNRLRQFACDDSAGPALKREVTRLGREAKQQVRDGLNTLTVPAVSEQSTLALIESIRDDVIGNARVDVSPILAMGDEIRDYIDKEFLSKTEAEIDEVFDGSALSALRDDLAERVAVISLRISHGKVSLLSEIHRPANELRASLQETRDALTELISRHRRIVAIIGDQSAGWQDQLKQAVTDFREQTAKVESALQRAPGAFSRLTSYVQKTVRVLESVALILENTLSLSTGAFQHGVAVIEAEINKIRDFLEAVEQILGELDARAQAIVLKVEAVSAWLDDGLSAVDSAIIDLVDASGPRSIKHRIGDLRNMFDSQHAEAAVTLLGIANASNDAIQGVVEKAADELAGHIVGISDQIRVLHGEINRSLVDGADEANAWAASRIDAAVAEAIWLIDAAMHAQEDFCRAIEQRRAELERELRTAADDLRESLVDAAESLVSEETRQQMEEVGRQIAEEIVNFRELNQAVIGTVDKGLKLAKAIGEMPKLPDLTFNVDKAEYVFDDLRNQIETSPFGSRVKEIGAGLKELGINVPSTQILDQVIPTPQELKLGFSQLVDSMGGMDFSDMFKKFRIKEIKKDEYQITHGIDEQRRQAWVRAAVKADYQERESMFDLGSFGVFTQNMKLRALSEVRQSIDGQTESMVNGSFRADWALHFGGVDLAVFRDVGITYDSHSTSFDVDPSKIEYHPSLRFISDVAKKLEGELPAGVKLIKDDRGIPVGAEASLETSIENPPPLGPVLIGPITIVGGLSILLSSKGQFVVKAYAGVGTRETPIFVQIGWLGGGAWVAGTISDGPRPGDTDGKRVTEFQGSVGVALGSTRAINLASVAKGSYSFLLFANAEFSNRGGVLRAGLSVRGSARLMAIATIYVYLLLQVTHSSKGGTTGTGQLRAKVRISRFYTLKVSKAVTRKF